MVRVIRIFLSELSKLKWLIFLLIAVISISVLMHSSLSFSSSEIKNNSNNHGLLDAKFSYSQSTAYEYFENYGVEGRIKYTQFQILDMIYPLFYSLLLASLLFKLFTKSKYNPYLFALFAGTFDYIENLLLFSLNVSFPHINKAVVLISSFATSLKWSLIIMSGVIMVFGFFKYYRDR
jgi:branched-subunit amino acid permease